MGIWHRERMTLDQAMKFAGMRWRDDAPRHITYDPTLRGGMKIVRQQRTDGTLAFAMDMMQKALEPLANGTYSLREAPSGSIPRYVVGPIRVINVYNDRTDLPAGKFPGQRERIVVPFAVVGWVSP